MPSGSLRPGAARRRSRRRWSSKTPSLREHEIRRRVVSARVAILATIGSDGRPHLVPFTFALDGDVLYSAIDAKPKSTRALKRLDNIRRDPRVAILVEQYEDDWSRLWWCRLEGTARVLDGGTEAERGAELLASKYPQYHSQTPKGPWIVMSVEAVAGWTASA